MTKVSQANMQAHILTKESVHSSTESYAACGARLSAANFSFMRVAFSLRTWRGLLCYDMVMPCSLCSLIVHTYPERFYEHPTYTMSGNEVRSV